MMTIHMAAVNFLNMSGYGQLRRECMTSPADTMDSYE